MPNTIKHLRSSTPGAKPLAARLDGQIAINSADKALFVLDSTGAVSTVATEAAVTAATTAVQTVNGKAGTSVTLAPADIGTNGVAPLDASGKVDLSNLPTLVESVNGKTGAAVLGPADIGTNGVAPLDATGKVDLANLPALVQSVNGKTGVAVLGPADIGTDGVAALDASGKIATAVVPDVVLGSLHYMGTWNAATNTPTLPDPTLSKGQYYVVSTAGTQFGKTFGVDSWVVSDGIAWGMVGAPESVTSVAGKIGDVVLTAADIASGAFTADRLGATPGNSLVLVTDATGVTNWVPKSNVAGELTELLVVDLSAGDVALSAAQWTGFWIFNCTGNAVARTLTLPALARTAIIKNVGTTTLTLQVFGGGSAVVNASQTVMTYNDGTNLTLVGGGSSVGKFTDLTDTFPNYIGKAGQLLRVNNTGTGLETANNTSGIPKAADFPFTFNHNCSVTDGNDGLVFDSGTLTSGDISGACVKAVPAGEFEVEAFIKPGRATLGNWGGIGVGFYGGGIYYHSGMNFNGTPTIEFAKTANSGGHLDMALSVDSYLAVANGGWHNARRFKPSPGALLIGINLAATATTTLAFTGWTSQQVQSTALASACLSTITGFTPSTSPNITTTSSVSANQNINVIPINSVDGVTAPTLRTTVSAASVWATISIPLPAGTMAGDAIVVGIRHQYGVLFDDIHNWTVISNFNGLNADGSSMCVCKVLTAADIAANVLNFRATASGNGCHVIAIVQQGTYTNIGVPMIVYVGGTSNSYTTDNIGIMYSADRVYWQVNNPTVYSTYFAAPPTHVGFCMWTNRSGGVMSIVCKSWRQSW